MSCLYTADSVARWRLPRRETRFDELARLVTESVPRRTALRRIGGFVAAVALTSPAEALGLKKKCPTGHAVCGSHCCPKGYSCHTHKGKKTCTCASPKKVCSGTCIDPRSDKSHCGSCGKKCKSGETCVNGKCKAQAAQQQPTQQQPTQQQPTQQQTTTPPTPTCTDGVKNGNETDVDCGGPNCPKCALGKTCSAATDCQSGVCTGGVCVAPAAQCSADHCGGSCPACANGKACTAGTDCTSGHCSGGLCVQCAAASDCTPATPGTCQKAACVAGLCTTAADDSNFPFDDGNPCTDDLCDHGMPSHPFKTGNVPCGTNHHCNPIDGTCIADTCTDGLLNGEESDTDCGGPTCPPCITGKNCNEDGDCISGHCSGGVCIECAVATDCGASTICRSYTCVSGACAVSYANPGTACAPGGPACSGTGVCLLYGTGQPCTVAATCASGNCTGGFCT